MTGNLSYAWLFKTFGYFFSPTTPIFHLFHLLHFFTNFCIKYNCRYDSRHVCPTNVSPCYGAYLDKSQWTQSETQEVPSEHPKPLFHYEGDWTLSQVTQKRFWSLPPWIYSKVVWTWAWANVSWCPWLITGVGQNDFQRSHATLTTIWFCDFHYPFGLTTRCTLMLSCYPLVVKPLLLE